MTPTELLEAARAAQKAGVRLVYDMPVCWRRPPGWPRGELLCVNSENRSVYSTDPGRLIRFLEPKLQEMANAPAG